MKKRLIFTIALLAVFAGCFAQKPVKVPGLSDFKTRDIVTMWGTIEDEPFYFLVMHWPSRLGGQQVSEFKRVAAAEIVRRAVDSVRT